LLKKVGVRFFGCCVHHDKLLLLEMGICPGQVVVVSIVQVIDGHFLYEQEDAIDQCCNPFGFVVGGARDVFSKLC
jgi:hypothetical protein